VDFHERLSLTSIEGWFPISVNPADTARGIMTWVAMGLLYVGAQRAAADSRWRRRAMGAIVVTALALVGVALLQAASPRPTHLFGVWKPRYSWAVFGPFTNRAHLAAYLAMAIPMALAFLAESAGKLADDWRRRRWLVFGDPIGQTVLHRGVAALALIVGIVASASRGGVGACLAALLATGLIVRRARLATLALVVVTLAALFFVDPAPLEYAFRTRGLGATRLVLWGDALSAFPRFPLFGAGFNAYGTLSPHYQTYYRGEWVGQVHNEYLQVLVDTGLAGALVIAVLLARLAIRAYRLATRSTVDAGLLAALLAPALHNIVDFNWQIPATAATFVVLAGLAMRRESRPRAGAGQDPAGP
jgi:O-antigen ligase